MLILSKRGLIKRENELGKLDAIHKFPETPKIGSEFVPNDFLYESSTPNAIFRGIVERSEEFYTHTSPRKIEHDNNEICFESNLSSEQIENNLVYAKFFPARDRKRAAIILPYWNAPGEPFDRIGFKFAMCGISALRISLPYHDRRRPVDCQIARHMISPNIGRTIQSIRQAVVDVRCGIDWLTMMGYKKISIVGVSLGSCIATIAAAHDNRIEAIVQMLMASNFSEVVWTGDATKHIRESFDGFVDLTDLKKHWEAISPDTYVSNLAANSTKIFMITAAYDSVFLPYLTDELVTLYNENSVPFRGRVFSCGHYTLADLPYSVMAFIAVVRWLRSTLR